MSIDVNKIREDIARKKLKKLHDMLQSSLDEKPFVIETKYLDMDLVDKEVSEFKQFLED